MDRTGAALLRIIFQSKEVIMSIATRFVRLCKADIHGVMDQMEDKGLLLKQYLRDMEEELDRKETTLRRLQASRDQSHRDHDRHTQECQKLEGDLALAIEKEKDDIARMLIRKIKPQNSHRDGLLLHIEALDKDIAQFRGCLEEQRLLYKQLQLRATEHFCRAERQEWEEAIAIISPHGTPLELSDSEVELELLRRKDASREAHRHENR
jgi:phage shock protein A